MQDFEPLLRSIAAGVEPTRAQKERAAASHNNLRRLLQSGQFGDRVLDSYLSGSYSRDTAIVPIDDVDVVVIIDPAGWPSAGFLFETRPSPEAILKSFARAIRYRYPDSSIYGQRRSVRLSMYERDIDVVPAIDGSNDVIWIPDGHTDDWIKSAPRIHAEVGSEINSRCHGNFKPVVKILKYWNSQLPSTGQLKSFAVESIAMAMFGDTSMPSLYEGLVKFFDFVSQFQGFFTPRTAYRWNSTFGVSLNDFTPSIPDASGVSDSVCKGLSSDVAGKFVGHATRSRDLMLDASQSRYEATAERLVEKALKVTGGRR